jgi:hypothetical protein
MVEALPPEEPFPVVLDPHQEAQTLGAEMAATLEAPAGQEQCISEPHIVQAAARTVTIVQTAVTSGRDPWAALREQYLKPKKRRKWTTATPDMPDLWSFAAASPQDTSSPQGGHNEYVQETLW